MARDYRMQKRAEARDQVRERIVEATMRLHDEKGVVPTTFAEVAERAGVGPATVSRHFPTLGDLVRACGAHVWHEMRPRHPTLLLRCSPKPRLAANASCGWSRSWMPSTPGARTASPWLREIANSCPNSMVSSALWRLA